MGTFGQTGFSPALQENFKNDPNPNNIQHHLLSIYLGYFYGSDFSLAVGYYHETIDPTIHKMLNKKAATGTKQDWESTKRGVRLGNALRFGKVDIRNLGGLIYDNITR